MNEKFYALPESRQQAILNAGYRVFAHNSYKNSPMSEIAGEAGISKSLLFHHFRNKKELYGAGFHPAHGLLEERLSAEGGGAWKRFKAIS